MATMGGPTPWWQLPEYAGKLNNLTASAPEGYTYDAAQMRYTPTVSSAATQAADRARQLQMQDELFQQEKQAFASKADAEKQSTQLKSQMGSNLSGALQGMQSFLQSAYNTPSPAGSIDLNSIYNGTGAGGAAPATVGHISAPSTAGIDSALATKQNAEFGKAKATAGSLGRSAISSTMGELAGRGLSATGGTAMRKIADRVAGATNPLADINVAQLGENAANARQNANTEADFAKTAYEGDIAQRGQDIAAKNAANSNANARASLMLQDSMARAQMENQKRMALSSLITNAMTGIAGAMGRLY